MSDQRQRIPLQSSYSFSSISSAPSSSSATTEPSRSFKRRYTSTDTSQAASVSAPVMNTFQAHSHYPESTYPQGKPQVTRTASGSRLAVATLPSMDPTPDDEDAIFIHPPFTDFPDAHTYREGLTYNLMAANPNWFLDPADYQTVNGGNPGAVKYPPQLEPPRGWCPSKKKEIKDGWPEGEEPRLRCTFCRRTYAGVNAKSMWRRHVFEKHKIAMSNRRADNQERKGRGSNKENKDDGPRTSVARGAARAELELEAALQKTPSKSKSRMRTGLPNALNHPTSMTRSISMPVLGDDPFDDSIDEAEQPEPTFPQLAAGDTSFSAIELENDIFRIPTSSSTPPLTPGFSPSSSLSLAKAIPESPYNPLLTPSFRHSPARLPSDQPWRFPSPSHPLHSSARELSLSMLVCGESSPVVRGLDVSPVVLVPASERSKRSIFSSPFVVPKKDGETPADKLKGLYKPSPRRLFSDSSLPTPLTDRLKFHKHRVPESPLGRGFTPIKPSRLSSLAKSTFSPTKTRKAPGLLGPIDLEGEDPFSDSLYKGWLSPTIEEEREISPPISDPECESPILRASQLSQHSESSGHVTSASSSSSKSNANDHDGVTLGMGLLEGFSLKERTVSSGSGVEPSSSSESEADVGHGLMLGRSKPNDRKRSAMFLNSSPLSGAADSSPTPANVFGNVRSKRTDFLMDRLLNRDSDYEIREVFHPKKKRRKTISLMQE